MQKWYDYFKVCNVENIKSPGMNDFMLGVNDALIACQNTVIAAESLGIGSCYIGDIMENYEKHKELLNLPDYTFPAAMITFGYYPENIKRVYRDRFDKEYVVFDNVYKRLDEDELKNMFKRKEENMPKTNTHDVNNFGELMYIKKQVQSFQ